MKRLLTSLAIAATLSASAQTEPLDTVTIPGRTIVSPSAPIQPSESTTLDITNTEISAPYTSPWYLRYAIANLGLYDVMPTTAGTVADWGTGSVSGMADTRTMPGMMAVNNGGFAVTQTVGPVSFTGFAEAVKYGGFMGVRTSYGFGGAATYNITDRLSITAFGSYYTSPGNMPPAMAGYVNIPNFGGYLDYDISGPWGIRLGAQAYHSMSSNHWETQPIVMPYFRISGRNVIGIDVGAILYQILNARAHGHGPFNPTIRPPVHK